MPVMDGWQVRFSSSEGGRGREGEREREREREREERESARVCETERDGERQSETEKVTGVREPCLPSSPPPDLAAGKVAARTFRHVRPPTSSKDAGAWVKRFGQETDSERTLSRLGKQACPTLGPAQRWVLK